MTSLLPAPRRTVALATTLTLASIFGLAGPALAIDDYPVKLIKDANYTLGSAHIQRISGHTWDIAVRDHRTNGREVCVKILSADPGPAIYYCDRTSSSADAVADHYRISYPWYQASLCDMGGLGCEKYIYKDPTD
ncbi:hypothetical protein Ade02nite_91400 [Paractinoplanes deccanensis]|uniref:Secreted protein n=1 Tax=Paractinoplanes deccanensis TaxID=113561 RepID=A0ABQ3YKG0_9ACTN|nr:hypothetical protein [Actinoplanes deccanensis]GID80499.1 hypothetical protein Ade02nite_91400 [Actinoplanes deccanensis]